MSYCHPWRKEKQEDDDVKDEPVKDESSNEGSGNESEHAGRSNIREEADVRDVRYNLEKLNWKETCFLNLHGLPCPLHSISPVN